MITHKPFNINRAIIALIIAIVFFLLYCWLGYLFLESRSQGPAVPVSDAFNYTHVIIVLAVVTDVFIYWGLRKKYIHRRYANIHIASVIGQLIVAPLLTAIITFLVITHMVPAALSGTGMPVIMAIVISCLVFFIIGHIFLILVILHRNKWPASLSTSADDQLQEFENH